MTKRQKRLEKLHTNARSVRFEDLHAVLIDCGFTSRRLKSGSSHHVYVKGKILLTVPYRRPHVKAIYVKKVLEILESMTV